MIIISPLKTYAVIKSLLLLMLAISCSTLLSGCNNQEISDESTLGSNNAAQTNPAKIERNSMDDVANVSKNSENSENQNVETTNTDQ